MNISLIRIALELGSVKTLCFVRLNVTSPWVGLMMENLTVGSRISHMLLHETAKAGEVGCHAGDAHHCALGCQGKQTEAWFQASSYVFLCTQRRKSSCLSSNSDVYFVPGSVLSYLQVLTHLIF